MDSNRKRRITLYFGDLAPESLFGFPAEIHSGLWSPSWDLGIMEVLQRDEPRRVAVSDRVQPSEVSESITNEFKRSDEALLGDEEKSPLMASVSNEPKELKTNGNPLHEPVLPSTKSVWAPGVKNWSAVFRPQGAPEPLVVPARGLSPPASTSHRSPPTSAHGKHMHPMNGAMDRLAPCDTLADALQTVHVRFNRTTEAKKYGISMSQDMARWRMPRPRGMVNRGNTCYMNAILQPLAHLAPFFYLFRDLSECIGHLIMTPTAHETFPLIQAMMLFAGEFEIEEPQSQTLTSPTLSVEHVKTSTKKKTKAQRESSKQTLVTSPKPALPTTSTPSHYSEPELSDIPFAPVYIYDALRKRNKFESLRGQQEDAEEFLTAILDCLHEEFSIALESQRTPHGHLEQDQHDGEWVEMGRKNRTTTTRAVGEALPSPIRDIFGGSLRSIIRRRHAVGTGSTPVTKESATIEPFYSLHLDISQVNTIDEAFQFLTQPENIDSTGIQKQLLVSHWPPVLVCHLKRFVYDPELGVRKLRKPIEYETSLRIRDHWTAKTLAPDGRAAPKGFDMEYRLCAVVYHHGESATGGHYTCDVLTRKTSGSVTWGQPLGRWTRMDDASLREVTPTDVVQSSAAWMDRMQAEDEWASGRSKGDPYLLFWIDSKLL